MKKARIILTAIIVLAIVGGALAFKAQRTITPAYAIIGISVASSAIGGFVYTTTVPLCVLDPAWFIGNGILANTFRTTIKTIIGFAPNGLTRTWSSVVCTPTFISITIEI